MDDNVFLSIKAGFVALMGGFSAAFGWIGWLVLAWIGCMVLDYLTGSAAAMKGGNWSSAMAREGIWHKMGMLVVVIVSAVTDSVMSVVVSQMPGMGFDYPSVILPVVLVWYILTEIGSVAENAVIMGAVLPPALLKVLKVANEKMGE